MQVGGNKNLYIILAVFVGAITAIIVLLYLYSRKQQKVFENAMNEVKDAALKYLKDHAEPPFSPYEDVTNQNATTEPASQTEEPLASNEAVELGESTTAQSVSTEIEIQPKADETTLNFKTGSMLTKYVQAPTNEPLPQETTNDSKSAPVKILKATPAKPKTTTAPKKQPGKDSKSAPTQAPKIETPTV